MTHPLSDPTRRGTEHGTGIARAVDSSPIAAEHPEHVPLVPVALAEEAAVDVGGVGVVEDRS